MVAVHSPFPSRSQPPVRLRLSSPAEILTAVPYLIGFAPKRSLVVICLRGKQVGLTMRLDLDVPRAQMRHVVIERIRADGAASAVLLLFDPDAGSGKTRPGADVASPLIRALERAGIAVTDALGVRAGRFWSYLCQNPGCCPPQGSPVPTGADDGHSQIAATFVGIGAAPLASREELEASIAAVTGAQLTVLEACYEQVLARPVRHPLERWMAAVARYSEGPRRPGGVLTPLEAAQLVIALQRAAIRDQILSWTAGPERSGILDVLRELAPLALEPFDAQVLTSLAWAAYVSGDGALAAVALERALVAEPTHTLARLLVQALDGGIGPDQMREVSLALSAMTDDRSDEAG